MTDTNRDPKSSIAKMDDEQLPVPEHRLHGPAHFLGLYGAEHVAATEFVIGATFVAMGATIQDILIGLLIGNTLAVLSFWLITAPIAVKTRLSLYTYIEHNLGELASRLYNGANVLIFVAISAAMTTVSATAVRVLFDIPPQVYPYPTNIYFALIAASASVIAVLVAYYGFNVVAEFATICTPWLMVMFTAGGMVLIPALNEALTGYKSNWHRLKGLKDNKPALITRAICLVFGFGLDAIGIMPFVYLFLPTWAVAIVCYTLLAKAAGADKSHPEAEQREQEFDRRVREYHAQLAAKESHVHVKDRSMPTKVIRAVWIVIGLVVPAILAWRVLFNSPNLYDYYVNRELFYDLTIWCTIIYFVFAWWDLQRSKSLRQAALSSGAATPAAEP